MSAGEGNGKGLVAARTEVAASRLEAPAPGSYWAYVGPGPEASEDGGAAQEGWALRAGTVLLLQAVEEVEGAAHTVRFAPHPADPGQRWRSHVMDDFYALYERAHDPASSRARDVEALQARLAGHQASLREVAGRRNPLIGSGAVETRVDALPALVGGDPERLRRQITLASEAAQAAAGELAAITGAIESDARALARFHAEAGTAALASIDAELRNAERLRSALTTFGLYLGDGVEVETLARGAPSDASDPLHLFRSMLYMDEELLVDADGRLFEGGADHSNWADLGDALADPSFRARVLPFPKSVVLMRTRRERKAYYEGGTLADALADIQENEGNRFQYLLVRDGANVHRVWCEATTQRIDALFPDSADAEEAFASGGAPRFRGLAGEGIRLSDIQDDGRGRHFTKDVRFTHKRHAHEAYALVYKRLLLMLWGLHDRLGLLGPFPPGKMSDLAFQEAHFRFVVDDADKALPGNRPTFEAWLWLRNQAIGPGARIVARVGAMWNASRAPGAFSYSQRGERYVQRWTPADGEEERVHRVSSREGRDVVEVEARPDHRHGGGKGRRTVSLHLEPQPTNHVHERERDAHDRDDSLKTLCVDGLEAGDLEHYFHDRRSRRHYLRSFALLQLARRVARERWRLDSALRASLAGHARAARLDVGRDGARLGDGDLERAAQTAISRWRVGRPLDGEALGKERETRQLYDVMHGVLADPADIVERCEALASALGSRPLRLVQDASGAHALYATTPEVARDASLEALWPYVDRHALAGRGTAIASTRGAVAMLASRTGEAVIHEWPEAAASTMRRARDDGNGGPGRLEHPTLRPRVAYRRKTTFGEDREALSSPLYKVPQGYRPGLAAEVDALVRADGGPGPAMDLLRGDAGAWSALLSSTARWMAENAKGGTVQRARLEWPVAVARLDTKTRREDGIVEPRYRMVWIGCDPLDLLAAVRPDRLEEVLGAVRRRYKHPEHHLPGIERAAAGRPLSFTLRDVPAPGKWPAREGDLPALVGGWGADAVDPGTDWRDALRRCDHSYGGRRWDGSLERPSELPDLATLLPAMPAEVAAALDAVLA